MHEVTLEEKFLFDLNGSLLLKGILTPEECQKYLDVLAKLKADEYADEWQNELPEDVRAKAVSSCERYDSVYMRLNGLPKLDAAFDDVIDHPRVLPYLREFIDTPQLVNSWAIEKSMGTGEGGWHRGIKPDAYRCVDGQIRTNMLNVVFFLTDNGPQDGCMMAIPNSHKNNIDLKWSDYKGLETPGSVAVTGKAGDVFLFSEAVVHSGLPKTTEGARSNLYFNYIAYDPNTRAFIQKSEPHNLPHYIMPPEVRARLSPDQKAFTKWMD